MKVLSCFSISLALLVLYPILSNGQLITNDELKQIFKSNVKGKTHSGFDKVDSYFHKGEYTNWLMSGLMSHDDYLTRDTLKLVNFSQYNSYGWTLVAKRRLSYSWQRGGKSSILHLKNKWQIKTIKGKTFIRIYEPPKNIFGRRNYLECFEVLQIIRGKLNPRRKIPVYRATLVRCNC